MTEKETETVAVPLLEAVKVAEELSVPELVLVIEPDGDSEELIEALKVEVPLLETDPVNDGVAEGEPEELIDPLALSETEGDRDIVGLFVVVVLGEGLLVLLAVNEGD